MEIPVAKPFVSDREADAVREVILSGWIAQGPKVREFEEAFAEFVGTREAVAVSSCTAALHLSLAALDIGEGDEVILPSFTFVASANVVLYQRARPVLADIDLETFTIDPEDVERCISPRTKAIMPVHLFGLAADMTPLLDLAERHGVPVVEDAACAHAATDRGRTAGALGLAGCFSFHPRKLMSTGEGGMITTDDAALARRLRTLRSQGGSVEAYERHAAGSVREPSFAELGYNYRMTDIQAAIGLVQLSKAEEMLRRRRLLAERYGQVLAGLRGLRLPVEPPRARHTYQSYVIRILDESPLDRDELMERLQARGISTRRGTTAIHLEPLYRDLIPVEPAFLARSTEAERTTLALPLYPSMSEAEQQFVTSALRELLGGRHAGGRQ